MPPKYKKKDCLVILVNVGCTDKTERENETSFLGKSKLLMRHLIQRRIFLRPKDEVGVIVMGTFETKNRLSFDNIVELNPLQIPTWDLLEDIIKLRGTNYQGNWIEGLSVVLEYLNAECVDQSATKTVILLTDFKEDHDIIKQYDVDSIVSDIKEGDISLLAVGERSLNADSEIELNPSEKVFANVCEMVEGEMMTFDDTLPKLMIYKDTAKTPMPWKVDMDFFDIPIPVVMYLKTTEDFKLPKWQLFTDVGTATVPVERNRALVDRNRQEVGEDEIITGYMYGRKFIPFSDEDSAALKYKSGPKGFTIYGFTKRELITMDCLAGKGSYIVVPAQQYASPFYSLVKAMADKNKVAIVRRVYRANLAPKMGVLFPRIDVPGQPWCLVYVELVFAEDRRIVHVKPLKSTMNKLSNAQENGINNLIDSMMLMDIVDDATNETKEAFEPGTVPDISRQHVWDKLTYRALRPNPLPPPPMSDFLNKFLEPPKSMRYKSKPVLESIKILFPVRRVRRKKKSRKERYDVDLGEPQPASEDVEQSTERAGSSKDKPSVENNPQIRESSDEELSEVAVPKEAASQAMEIDLDELANDM